MQVPYKCPDSVREEAVIFRTQTRHTLQGRLGKELSLPLAQLAGDLFDNFRTEVVQDAVDDAGNRGIGF